MSCAGMEFADQVAERLAREEDATRYVAPSELQLVAHSISQMAAGIFEHAEDSDDPAQIAALLLDLRDAKQALAEAFSRVEVAYVSCAGEKKMEFPGVGVVEVRKQIKRTAWRNDDLATMVINEADAHGEDAIAWLLECARPSWRVGPLRERGIDPADFCLEEPQGYSVQLPSRPIEERGF